MSAPPDGDAGITYALVCLKTGLVLEVLQQGATPPNGKLSDFASAAPELLRADGALALGQVFSRLGSAASIENFREIVLLSPAGAHALLRMEGRPDTVVLALCSDPSKLGFMLSGLRARCQVKEAVR